MWDKNFRARCDTCGKYCLPADEQIPFGCANPEDPEPYDPDHFCAECWPAQKAYWLKSFNEGSRCGYWQKSRAEQEAAEECGLVWVGSNSIGIYNTPSWRFNTYVTKGEHIFFTKLKETAEKEAKKVEEVWL
jgi:hypothetical protein